MNKGIAHISLLDTYSKERLPVIAQMLNKATELLRYNFETAPQPDEAEIRKDMIQLGVNYRGSPLLYYEPSKGDAAYVKGIGYNRSSETDALPGDRAPEAPGLSQLGERKGDSTISLFDIFSPSLHTALVFYDVHITDAILDRIFQALRSQPADTVYGVLLVRNQGFDTFADISTNIDLALFDREGHAFKGYNVQKQSRAIGPQSPMVIIVGSRWCDWGAFSRPRRHLMLLQSHFPRAFRNVTIKRVGSDCLCTNSRPLLI